MAMNGKATQAAPIITIHHAAVSADAPMAVVDVEWMFHEMHGSSDTGAAAGPAGYGSNYLSVLAEDRHCVEAMALFVTHMVNNTLPATVRTFLTTCTLVSLSKDNGGRRPIAIGDLFYRLASRFVVSKISKTVSAILVGSLWLLTNMALDSLMDARRSYSPYSTYSPQQLRQVQEDREHPHHRGPWRV